MRPIGCKVHPQTVAKVGEAACAQCHPDQWLCNDCHHKGYKNDGTGWKTQHPPIVKSAGTDALLRRATTR